MNFQRSNTKSENSFSKDLSGHPASKTEKSKSQRDMLQSKSFSSKGSRTPGSFNQHRDPSFKRKDEPKKNLAKSVIKQHSIGSIKDWNDLSASADLRESVPEDIDLSAVPEEKVVEYEAHFPVLGGSGETPKSEGSFIKDVLKSSNIVKVLSMKDSSTSSPTRSERSQTSEGFHIGKDLLHGGFESELTGFYQNLLDGHDASLVDKVQAGEGKEIYEESLTTQTNTENNVYEDPLHIPNDEIRSDALRESESDLLRTPLNSEVEESNEPLFVRIPLELTLAEYQEDSDSVRTPTHKEDWLRYQENQSNVYWQPENFTEIMQIILSPEKEKSEQEAEETPTFAEEKLASEIEQELVLQEILKEVNGEGEEEQNKKSVKEETPTIAEEKLASEIEQEDLVQQIINEQNKVLNEEHNVRTPNIVPTHMEEKLAAELEQNILEANREVLMTEGQEKTIEGVVPSTQPEKLESEIEQEEIIAEINNGNIEPPYFGQVQKAKQDAMLVDAAVIQTIAEAAAETMVERPANTQAFDASEVFERKVGEIEFERSHQAEEKPVMKRRAVAPEPELEQVEENIVVSEEPNMHLTPPKDSKSLKKSDASLMDQSKMSLEHLVEESPLNATRSTDAALSVQRIDVIKEEAAEVLYSSNNILFKEIDKNLEQVQDYKRTEMIHPAINTLKKNLAILDAHMLKKEDFSVKEMNRALIECNTELADCYAHIQDFRSSVDYARAAYNLDLTNLKAIYYLGAGLKKNGDPLGAYEILKDVRKLKGTEAEKSEFYGLAIFELESLERKVQQEAKAQTPHQSLAEQTPKGVRKELEDLSERDKKNNKNEGSAVMSLGMALAIGTVTGLASWFVGKGYTKVPQRKVSMYSIGLGVLVGGVALAVKGIGKKN